MHDEEKQRNYELAEKLILEQNFTAAVIAGAIAMVLAAVAYGIVVEAWPVVYGFAAAGVGIMVGFFVGFLGRGVSLKFSVVAAVYTIAGCILGNLLVRIVSLGQSPAVSPIDVIQRNPLSELARWSVAGLSLIHVFYWFIAVVAAVFLAKRPLSRAQRLALHMLELKT